MSNTLTDRYVAAKQAATHIHDEAKAANDGEGRPLTDTERAEFDRLIGEATELKAQIKQAQDDANALRDLGQLAEMPGGDLDSRAVDTRSPGERFVESPQYQAMLDNYGGNIPQGTRVQMGSVNIGSVRAALSTSPGTQNPAVRYAPSAMQIVDLLDAITIIEAPAGASVKTFTGTFTNVAADVAEGAAKPEATLTWASATVTLATIAQHLPVTNQTLAHNAGIRQRIDAWLVNGIRARMGAKVAAILATATGFQTQAFDTDIRTSLRKAVTLAQIGGAQLGAGPASILIGSTDAESLDLEMLATLMTSPGEAPNQAGSIWRTPLVVSPNIPSGFAYVGDLSQVELWVDESGISVTTGWVNNQFVENELTILAETEAEANVFGAGALVKADIVTP